MAPTQIAGATVTGTATSRTFAVTAASAAGDTLLAVISTNGTGCTVSALTDTQGNVYTLDGSFTSTSPLFYAFRSPGATGGSGSGATAALSVSDHFTATTSGSGNVELIGATAGAVGVLDVSSSVATGTSTTPSVSATPTVNNDTCVSGFVNANGGGSPTVNSPFTSIGTWQSGSNAYNAMAYDALSGGSGTAQTSTLTIVSAAWRGIMWAFKPGSTPASVTGVTATMTLTATAGSVSAGALAPYTVAGGSAASGTTTCTVTVSHNAAVGDTLVMGAGCSGTGITVTGLADSQGNPYTQADSDYNQSTGIAAFVARISTALASGIDTITATYSGTTGAKTLNGRGCAGIAASSPVDVAISNDASTGTAMSVGPSSTLAQASEWAVAFSINGNGGGTPTSWTGGFTAQDVEAPASNQVQVVADQVVSSTAALTAGATIVTNHWAMLLLTLKAGGGSSVTGAVATSALAAPAGSVSAGAVVAGPVSTLALAAPAGAAGAVVTVTGPAAALTLAAAAGTVTAGAVTAGLVAPLALAAPAGVVHAGATVAGATAGLALAAPPGTAAPAAAVTVAASWFNARAISSGFYFPLPAARPVQVAVANTPGDWMIALVTWRQAAAGAGVSASVADDAHNYWEPLGAPSGDSAAAGVTRTAIWYAPAARAATIVQAAPTGPVLALAVRILDVSGMSPWGTLTAITPGEANAATALTLAVGAPASQALMLAGLGTDNNSDTISGPGAGWTSLAAVSATNGVDHTADIQLNTAWRVTTGAASAAWSSSGTLDLSGVTAGILVTAAAPAQPNLNWPVTVTELAPAAGPGTPPSQIAWTPLSARSLAMDATQGRQYTLGQLQAGQGTLTIDNPDGAVIPPGTGSFTGIDSGTPVRQRMILPASPTPFYVPFSGYMQRWPFALDGDMLRGQTQATIIDAWGYAAGTLDSMGREELRLDGPYALWPLDDPAGTTAASNLAPGNQNPLVLVTSKNGANGATEAFGANSGLLIGDTSAQVTTSGKGGGASGMWSQTLTPASQNTNGYGYGLLCLDSNYPPISGGVTIEYLFGLTEPTQGFSATTTGSQFNATNPTYANGTPVTLSTAAGFSFPGGFSAFTVYYVINASGSNFQLSATLGGSAITVTSSGAGFMIATTAFKSVIWSARNIAGPVVELNVSQANGTLSLLYKPAGGTNTIVTISSSDFRVNGPYHVAVSFNQTTYAVTVNGLSAVSGSFSGPLAASFDEFDAGGLMSARSSGGVQGFAWTGYSAFAAIYPLQLTQVRILSHFWATINGLPGEAACDRIERILEYAALTGRRFLGQQVIPQEGDLTVTGQDIGGQPAATSVTNIAASTLPAMMYVAPTGDLFYLAKFHAWDNPVKWVLGDNVAGGEIPFLPTSYATDYDPARVVNDIQLTQLDTSVITVPSAAALEAASRAQYGDQPYQVTGYLTFDGSSSYSAGGGLNDLADWIAYTYAKPRQRIQSVTVDAARHPTAWAFVAGVSVGDMVTVNLRPATMPAGTVISVTARITQTARSTQFSQDNVAGSVACVLDYAPEENALTCDDPVRGLLNGSNVLGW